MSLCEEICFKSDESEKESHVKSSEIRRIVHGGRRSSLKKSAPSWTSDASRRVVVVSAAGKRYKDDHKVTDLLYLCYAHLQYGVSCDGIYQMICDRYLAIRDELGLRTDLEGEFAALRRKMDQGDQSGRAGLAGRVFRGAADGRLSGLRLPGQHYVAEVPSRRFRRSGGEL